MPLLKPPAVLDTFSLALSAFPFKVPLWTPLADGWQLAFPPRKTHLPVQPTVSSNSVLKAAEISQDPAGADSFPFSP